MLRKDLDGWHFLVKGEGTDLALSRFLIAFEELRVRLAPSKYPNLEISDEGYLWFNVDSRVGTVEVLAFPHGFGEAREPFIVVSIPRKAEDLELRLLDKLRKISSHVEKAQLLAEKTGANAKQILASFKRDQHPPLAFTSDYDEILRLKREGIFFSYLGIQLLVLGETVSHVELMIRNIVSEIEDK